MFTRENSTSINFLLTALSWIVIGTTMGLILALEFVFPDLFRGFPYLVFGRLRQAHVNTVMFAFLSLGMMGLWYYIVPQLTGRRLWSEPLGNVACGLWNIGLFVGIIGILTTHTQSREYTEMIYVTDVILMSVFVLNLVNLYMTIAHRIEAKMYVSLWYIIGTLLWIIPLYFIGNVMWRPPTGAMIGINDVIFNWFFGHNILGLWFTTGLIPVIYYIVPKDSNTPLFSHFLSLIGFWTIVFVYTGVGGHHLLWTPIPHWLKTMAIADSIGMTIPVTAFLLNIYLTLRGNWTRVGVSLPLRFVVLGWFAYIVVSYQGTHFALKGVNLLTHFTQYVPSHAHLSLLLFSAVTIMGGMYYVIPRVSGRRMFSPMLGNIQFALMVLGFTFFLLGFVLAGFVQGGNWVHMGVPVYASLEAEKPFFALRAAGGIVLYLSFILFAVNVFGTWIAGKPTVKPDPAELYEQQSAQQEGALP